MSLILCSCLMVVGWSMALDIVIRMGSDYYCYFCYWRGKIFCYSWIWCSQINSDDPFMRLYKSCWYSTGLCSMWLAIKVANLWDPCSYYYCYYSFSYYPSSMTCDNIVTWSCWNCSTRYRMSYCYCYLFYCWDCCLLLKMIFYSIAPCNGCVVDGGLSFVWCFEVLLDLCFICWSKWVCSYLVTWSNKRIVDKNKINMVSEVLLFFIYF